MTQAKNNPAADMQYSVLPERMPMLPLDQLSEEQRIAMDEVIASRGHFVGSFMALIRTPRLLDRIQKLGETIRFQGALDLRVNRVASLLTTRHWSNQFEWSGNTVLALKAGLKPHVIEAIGEGRRPQGMAVDEETAYDFATEALVNKSVSDATYQRAVEQFGENGVLEMLAIISYYGMLALIMNVVRTPDPEGRAFSLPPMPHTIHPKP